MRDTDSDGSTKRRKTNFPVILILLIIVIVLAILLISRYNRAPEPIPSGAPDTSAIQRIPPDSLSH